MTRTIILTGASDGIGREAARRLAADGERVVVVGRDAARTAAVARELGAPHHVADFGDLAQVRRLAGEIRDAYPHIDVLANNAGAIMPRRRRESVDGHERTMQINHLAPFLLTTLLLPRLIASRAAVVNTSSLAARLLSRFDVDDLDARRRFDRSRAYGNAKLANLLFTKELHRRYAAEGLRAVAVHPGIVATSFAGGAGGLFSWVFHAPVARAFLTDAAEGGARLARFAGAGDRATAWRSGGYYARTRPGRTSPLADDAALGAALWARSEALVAASAPPLPLPPPLPLGEADRSGVAS